MTIGVPAYEQIRDILREDIISGKIPKNSRLILADIAKRFNVSQNPVREALQWLQGEGLIVVSAHKGARVLSLEIHHIKNIYQIRGVIEGLLARQSVDCVTDENIAQFKEINAHYRKIITTHNRSKIRSVNKDFHKSIYSLSNNPEALTIYERYEGLLGSLRRKYGFQSSRLSDAVQEHSDMLEVLGRKDGARIEGMMKSHIEMAMKEILALMGES